MKKMVTLLVCLFAAVGAAVALAASGGDSDIATEYVGNRLKIDIAANVVAEESQVVVCWGSQEGGETVDSWAHNKVLDQTLTAAGGSFEVSAVQLGIADGDSVRVFVTSPKIEFYPSLTTSSSSYFDVGVGAGPTTVMTLHGALTQLVGVGHFMSCTVNGAATSVLSLAAYVRGNNNFGACMNDGTSMDTKDANISADTSDHWFVLDAPNHRYLIGETERVDFGSTPTLSTAGNIYLGAGNRVGTGVRDFQPVKIYSFSLANGGAEVRNLVPAKKSGTAGLYDLVSTDFIEPSGTGTVTLGGSVTNTIGGATVGSSAVSVYQQQPAAQQKGIRIAHIGDPQIGFVTSKIEGRSQEHFAENYARDLKSVEAMIPLVNAEKPDLVFIAGDLMQNAEDIEKEWPRLLPQFEAPVLIAPGNHDMGNTVTAANLERFTTLFGYAWTSMPTNGYRIIVMNSQFWYATDGSATANDAKQSHDEWLDAEIAAAVAAGEKIIFCSHIPPFENTVDEADSYFNCPTSMRTTFMDKLIANGVDYWLCGHTHTQTQHQYANANGTLNIWTAEAVCENHDGSPSAFHIFEIPEGGTTATWKTIAITLPDDDDDDDEDPDDPPSGGDDPVVPALDDGYVRLDYIVATGTQWIDTGYKANSKSQVYLKFAADDIENSLRLFGCGDSTSRLRALRRKTGNGDAQNNGVCFIDMSSGSSENINAPKGFPDSEIHEIFASNDYKAYDGVEIGGMETRKLDNTIDKTLYLLSYNNLTGGNPFVGRLYACQISEENELKMNLVPALHKASGVIGLYDLCSGNFLTNSGTGSFEGPLTVNVKCSGENIVVSGICGAPPKSLCLCWGSADCGEFGWTNGVTLIENLPMGLFECVRKASDLGIKKGDVVRAFLGDLKELTRVDFIRTDDTSYFDLGVGADPTTVMSLHGALTQTRSGVADFIAGFSVMKYSSPSLSFGIYGSSANLFGTILNDGVSQQTSYTTMAEDTAEHWFVLDAPNHCYTIGQTKLDFTSIQGWKAPELSTLGSLYLGSVHRMGDNSGALNPTPLKIYSFTLTKGGEEVMNLVPVKDGGTACLYDAVTGKVFVNNGSGTITASSTETGVVYVVRNVSATASSTYTPRGFLIFLK